MAISFKAPASPKRDVLLISNFLGADFTNSPGAVDLNKSPNIKNMIRDVPGKVRKRMGYETIETFTDEVNKINGYHKLSTEADPLYHVGTKLYQGETALFSSMANVRSRSWEMQEKLYIIDGTNFLVFDGTAVASVETVAYIPTLTIAKAPSGGGTDFEPLNLLTAGFIETFLGTAGATAYHLTFGGLDATAVKVEVLNSSGVWVVKTLTTDYTVDRTNGIINFTTAPGVSPITGEDNVRITAYRTVSGYADRIKKCTTGILYGVNGAMDRLFLTGNPDYPNQDWYSDQYDFTYFADTSYARLGSESSAVVGYSIINNYLAAHKDDTERSQTVILRSGTLTTDDEVAFPIINTLQGPGAIAKFSFQYLSTEPLFLTNLGIYAVTTGDITGEKYSQNRSFYLDGRLLKESNLENAFAYVYKDLYWLCINNVAYVLDGLQPIQTDKSAPYSTRQYVGFYETNIPAHIMWEVDGVLYFGTIDGKICRFYSDTTALGSYNDDGVAIECIWDTPDFDGELFYKNKTFRYLAVRLKTARSTGIKIYVQKKGVWDLIKEETQLARYFSFENFSFENFTFSCDRTEKTVATKIRVSKVDKARFRYLNSTIDEPFGLFDIALEYVENGNFRT